MRHASLTFLAVLVFTVGCGESGPATYPVTGKLTVGGQPVGSVQVTFSPIDASLDPASGRTSADGTYTLTTGSEGKEGALAGKYKVVLMPQFDGEPDEATKAAMAGGAATGEGASSPGGEGMGPASSVPQKYMSASTSDKEVEVTAGENTINIDL